MSTKEHPVEIKGQKEGLWIFLDDRIALHEVFSALEEKLASSNNFFQGAEVTIDTGTRLLTNDEKKALRTIVESTHSLQIKELTNIGKPQPRERELEQTGDEALDGIQEEPVPDTHESPEPSPIEPQDNEAEREPEPLPAEPQDDEAEEEDDHSPSVEREQPPEEERDRELPDSDEDDDEFMKFLDETFRIPVKGHWEEKETYSSDYLYENEETAFYFRGTVRSGQSLEFPGNIIILGDVNPGAYVVASGDIIVMGRLHGVVHAGAEGEERAVAIGMNFRPSQLRIAQYIGRPADEGPRTRKKRPQAEKAYIKDGAIVIEPLL